MQTRFTAAQLAKPEMASSESEIRKCVHCGFCNATCPTYQLLGDELDGPRGRIYLMQDMLENQRVPSPEVVKHIDRCLSCLACKTTCPSSVNYMHLVDHARAYIEEHYRRPLIDRVLRAVLAFVLPHPKRFRMALGLARFGKPFAPLVNTMPGLKPVAAMLALAPDRLSPPLSPQASCAAGSKGRVVLLQGCAEPVLAPQVRAAAVRLINRAGYDVDFASGEVCCGALVHHLGREDESLQAARRNVDVWTRQIEGGGLTAIIVTTSGCGTTIKDYGFMLRADPAYAEKAARVSALAKDVSEFLASIALPTGDGRGLTVAYHAACSLQHGQKITDAPKRLLIAAGYAVKTPAEAHLCCGSAGTYNILQPEIAAKLGIRKAANIERLAPDVIAAGNIGCAVQIGARSAIPVVHTVELLDWATGGPPPTALLSMQSRSPQ
jgi:glycolate oxidase iron-sulfur subunit